MTSAPQRFADQRNAVRRLATPDRPIDEFDPLLVEAHDDRSPAIPVPRSFDSRGSRHVEKTAARKGEITGWAILLQSIALRGASSLD
jgi:hypothetical protein